MRNIEVFTCDCYPPGEIIRIVEEALKRAGADYTLREYNITKDPEEYSAALDKYGRPFGFKECLNIFIDGKRVIEGKPSIEELLLCLQPAAK